MRLGPQVVHGSRHRPQVALTFHGQGPVPMADALLAGAERAGALAGPGRSAVVLMVSGPSRAMTSPAP